MRAFINRQNVRGWTPKRARSEKWCRKLIFIGRKVISYFLIKQRAGMTFLGERLTGSRALLRRLIVARICCVLECATRGAFVFFQAFWWWGRLAGRYHRGATIVCPTIRALGITVVSEILFVFPFFSPGK